MIFECFSKEVFQMKQLLLRILVLFLAILTAPPALEQKTRINWTAVAAAQTDMYLAQKQELFKKNALAIHLIHIPSNSRLIHSILVSEIAFSFIDVNHLAH